MSAAVDTKETPKQFSHWRIVAEDGRMTRRICCVECGYCQGMAGSTMLRCPECDRWMDHHQWEMDRRQARGEKASSDKYTWLRRVRNSSTFQCVECQETAESADQDKCSACDRGFSYDDWCKDVYGHVVAGPKKNHGA
jgi:hypothetical protein